MGLSDAKEAELKNMPKLEFITRKSKDGKYIIHKTIITDIKPTAYYEKVLSSESEQAAPDAQVQQSEVEA